MLINFSVTNFRSIKERQTFSMEAMGKVKELPDHTFTIGNYHLLKAALVYGRNSSGKSNLLKAIVVLFKLVKESANYRVGDKILRYEPFVFDALCQTAPVEFEINFFGEDKIRYNYYVAFNDVYILEESLYHYPHHVRAKLFIRKNEQPIDYGNLKGNKKEIENTLYPNQLFLSKIGTHRLEQLLPAYQYLAELFFAFINQETIDEERLLDVLKKSIIENEIPYFLQNINTLIREADTNIEEVSLKDATMESFQFKGDLDINLQKKIVEEFDYKELKTKHLVFDDNQVRGSTDFPLKEESTGTIKFLSISGLLLRALHQGKFVIIDELDKNLHPHLTALLIKLMHSQHNNPNNVQLIFATHDTTLMTPELFRRDQIWFTEKEEDGSTQIYSLGDLRGVRKGIDYEKYYLEGAFGGIPVINEHNINLKFDDGKAEG